MEAVDLRLPRQHKPNFVSSDTNARSGPLAVCCVLEGDKKYGVEDVLRLEKMVRSNMEQPFKFYCLTNQADAFPEGIGIELVSLPAKFWGSGWWAKLALFYPALVAPGTRCLYLDLDVVVTGELDILADAVTDAPLVTIENFSPNKSHCLHNSSVMFWRSGDKRLRVITEQFDDSVRNALHGDQCWLWRCFPTQIANWPRHLVNSYKYHCRGRGLPSSARVIVFHGDPKPGAVADKWVKEAWR